LALEDEGWTVHEASSGEEAIDVFQRTTTDVVLIDIMLPGIDGFELCRNIRKLSDVPRRHGLPHAPTHTTLLLASRQARTTISRNHSHPKNLQLESGRSFEGPSRQQLVMPNFNLEIWRSFPTREKFCSITTEVVLTKTEFRLLCELAHDPGGVFSRELLLDKVWGYGYFGDGRLVDVHIRRLRMKIEVDPANPTHVVTVRGLGYRLQS
jgi:DNA-binding response OmpR family regulator